jgi:CRISPR-associated protein (TIGR02584 family)
VALLFAIIGPNPAPVTEALWALARQRGVMVEEVHLVALAESWRYLELELLGEGGALAALREVLPGVVPAGDAGVIAHRVRDEAGRPLEDDAGDEGTARYQAAIWAAAHACVARAGARPVIHLLGGGRLRTMTAYATAVFQLLARPGDELLDVRVSDRRVEGGSGFFFPEQGPAVLTAGGVVEPASVEVRLVPVAVVRLGALVSAAALASFATAAAAAQAGVEGAAPPRLRIELAAGRVLVGADELQLTAAQRVYLAMLALARRDGDDDGWVSAHAEARLRALAPVLGGLPWADKIRDKAVRGALGLDGGPLVPLAEFDPDAFNKLRADLRTRLVAQLRALGRPGWEELVVPRRDKPRGAHRLELAPERIEVVMPSGPAP